VSEPDELAAGVALWDIAGIANASASRNTSRPLPVVNHATNDLVFI
jgi:hypothetical protein